MRPRHDNESLRDTILAGIRHARFSAGVVCPRCASDRVRRWGSFSGRQRYHCRGCRRTFSDLTLTPAAYSKRIACWNAYPAALAAAVSVRRAAAFTGIHPCTAFRWRHRLLAEAVARTPETLVGWTEIACVAFAYSEKGRRTHTDQRRGAASSRLVADPHQRTVANVVIACDRKGNVVSAIASVGTMHGMTAWTLEPVLRGRSAGPVAWIAREGHLGPVCRVARRFGGTFHDARAAGRRNRPLIHVQTVAEYTRQLRAWMPRFRGVATRYLSNYLTWHRVLDRTRRIGFQNLVLMWPVGPVRART